MDIVIALLRAIHIIAGILWVGFAVMMTFYVSPTVARLGPDGSKFMYNLLRHTPWEMTMPVLAILTTGAGVILYAHFSGLFNGSLGDWLSDLGNVLLSIGALFGLFAFGHGIGMGRITTEIKTTLTAMMESGGPPSQEQVSKVQALGARLGRNSMVAFWLMVVAVLGMSLFRYL